MSEQFIVLWNFIVKNRFPNVTEIFILKKKEKEICAKNKQPDQRQSKLDQSLTRKSGRVWIKSSYLTSNTILHGRIAKIWSGMQLFQSVINSFRFII